MPSPPRKGESKDAFISRCIRYIVKNEGKSEKKASAICYSMWRRKGNMEEKEESEYKNFTFSVPMETKVTESLEEDSDKKTTSKNRAVALIGDRFYHGAFFPASELKKAHKGWENTLHDINHQGTTSIHGFTATSDIRYFVGYNKNVSYDEENKSMSMDINVVDDTEYAKAWRGYVKLCEEAGQVPNVSIHFMAKTKQIKAKDLPDDVDYSAFGYKENDPVTCIYDVQPGALSTVYRGACNDASGCGIGKCDCKDHTEEEVNKEENTLDKEEKEALIKWLQENERHD